jgi:hypothetical protein
MWRKQQNAFSRCTRSCDGERIIATYKEPGISNTEIHSDPAVATLRGATFEMKLEVVVMPVSDVDRAKRFYSDLGWSLGLDYAAGDDYRVIQFTLPGSGCLVIFGKNIGRPRRARCKDCYWSSPTSRPHETNRSVAALRLASCSTTPAVCSNMGAGNG